MAEMVGFEPTDAFTSTVFKTASLNHSDTSPSSGGNLPSIQENSLAYLVRLVNGLFRFLCFFGPITELIQRLLTAGEEKNIPFPENLLR